jgi:hypothetical protein
MTVITKDDYIILDKDDPDTEILDGESTFLGLDDIEELM